LDIVAKRKRKAMQRGGKVAIPIHRKRAGSKPIVVENISYLHIPKRRREELGALLLLWTHGDIKKKGGEAGGRL